MSGGAKLIVASAVAGFLAAFPLRTRLPAPAVAALLALAGAAVGWGGMLVQPDPSIGEFVVAVVALAFLVPAHVRIVLGPFGPQK
jgi:hypothetical protein